MKQLNVTIDYDGTKASITKETNPEDVWATVMDFLEVVINAKLKFRIRVGEPNSYAVFTLQSFGVPEYRAKQLCDEMLRGDYESIRIPDFCVLAKDIETTKKTLSLGFGSVSFILIEGIDW